MNRYSLTEVVRLLMGDIRRMCGDAPLADSPPLIRRELTAEECKAWKCELGSSVTECGGEVIVFHPYISLQMIRASNSEACGPKIGFLTRYELIDYNAEGNAIYGRKKNG